MDCSLPGASVHWDSPGKNPGVGCHAHLQRNLPNLGVKPRSLALQADSLPSELPGKPGLYISRTPGYSWELLGTYAEKTKTLIGNNTCTPMFKVVLFKIAKTWKPLKCSSTDDWIKKMWYIYNG